MYNATAGTPTSFRAPSNIVIVDFDLSIHGGTTGLDLAHAILSTVNAVTAVADGVSEDVLGVASIATYTNGGAYQARKTGRCHRFVGAGQLVQLDLVAFGTGNVGCHCTLTYVPFTTR